MLPGQPDGIESGMVVWQGREPSWSSVAAGLSIVGLFPHSDEADASMAEGHRMTAADPVDKLLASEHADVLRDSMAWLVTDLVAGDPGPTRAVAVGGHGHLLAGIEDRVRAHSRPASIVVGALAGLA